MDAEYEKAKAEITAHLSAEKKCVPIFFDFIKDKKIRGIKWSEGSTLTPTHLEWKNHSYYIMHGVDQKNEKVWAFLDRKECSFKHWEILN